MSLFRRIAKVEVETEAYGTIGIENLRINFRVEKTATRTVNTASIEIYNLSSSTYSKIGDINNTIILSAGYEEFEGAKVIFKGDIDQFQHKIMPPNRVAHIEAGDGLRILRETVVSLAFNDGIKASEILDEIASKLQGITVRDKILTGDKAFANGWSFVGSAADALDKVANSLQASWSIQNGELQIVPITGNNQTQEILISSSTGLIGSPEKIHAVMDQLDGARKPPEWNIWTQLQPSLEPRGVVQVESENLSGLYTVESVIHIGDNYGANWSTIIEVFQE